MGASFFPPWITPNSEDADHNITLSCGGHELSLTPWSGCDIDGHNACKTQGSEFYDFNHRRRSNPEAPVVAYGYGPRIVAFKTRYSSTCCPPPDVVINGCKHTCAGASLIADVNSGIHFKQNSRCTEDSVLSTDCKEGEMESLKRCRAGQVTVSQSLHLRSVEVLARAQVACNRALFGDTTTCKSGIPQSNSRPSCEPSSCFMPPCHHFILYSMPDFRLEIWKCKDPYRSSEANRCRDASGNVQLLKVVTHHVLLSASEGCKVAISCAPNI